MDALAYFTRYRRCDKQPGEIVDTGPGPLGTNVVVRLASGESARVPVSTGQWRVGQKVDALTRRGHGGILAVRARSAG